MQSGDYYRRLFEAYLLKRPSHLDFWHETPEANSQATFDRLGEYYLTYRQKTAYPGPFDSPGVPLLNYRGKLGLQVNPIAIAQYGLAQFNRFRQTDRPESLERFLGTADWLVQHLERTSSGSDVWCHHFEWPYREILRPPWASALAQGQGISVLVRANLQTGKAGYLDAARRALAAFERSLEKGGVISRDPEGTLWLEEYPVHPPSHILNGAIAASWGLFDLGLATGDPAARGLFDEAVGGLLKNLSRYDTGFWSLYELPSNGTPMLASPFYHRLHIAQLKVLYRMTGQILFDQTGARWETYQGNFWCRTRALWGKALFKLCRY